MCALCGDVVPAGAAAVLVAQMIHHQAMWGYWALPLHPLVHPEHWADIRQAAGYLIMLLCVAGMARILCK